MRGGRRARDEPALHPNENVIAARYTVFARNRASEATQVLTELHRMRYMFRPELDMLGSAEGLEIVEAREWITEQEPSLGSWNACFVPR
jgi:hypothetical protein